MCDSRYMFGIARNNTPSTRQTTSEDSDSREKVGSPQYSPTYALA